MGKPMLGGVVVSGYKRQNVGRFKGVKVEVPTISNDSSAEHEIFVYNHTLDFVLHTSSFFLG